MYLRGDPQVGHVCVAIAGGGGGGGLDIRDMSKMVGIANGLRSRYPAKYPPSMKNMNAKITLMIQRAKRPPAAAGFKAANMIAGKRVMIV